MYRPCFVVFFLVPNKSPLSPESSKHMSCQNMVRKAGSLYRNKDDLRRKAKAWPGGVDLELGRLRQEDEELRPAWVA